MNIMLGLADSSLKFFEIKYKDQQAETETVLTPRLLRESHNFPVMDQELVVGYLSCVINPGTYNISEGREAAVNAEKAELCCSVLPA